MKEKELYPLKCPVCGCLYHAEKSTLMKVGVNSGHANCINCNEFLHIQFNEEKQQMEAEIWEDYVDRIRLTNEDVKFFEDLLKIA